MSNSKPPSRAGEPSHGGVTPVPREANSRAREGNASARDISAHETDILPGLHEASNPYWDWLWGTNSAARVQLQRWLNRATSELSKARIRTITRNNAVAGGCIGVPGRELQTCRKADLLALLQEVRRDAGGTLKERLRTAGSLFAPVAESEFYLSRIWVNFAFRGQGIGRELLEMLLRDGRERGFSRFRLDVAVGNGHAIRMYEKAGFVIDRETGITGSTVSYCSMVRAS